MSYLGARSAILAANLLRVLRGSGRPFELISDIEAIAEGTTATLGRSSDRESASNELIAPLAADWRRPDDLRYPAQPYIESIIADASLRLVAARLSGAGTEETKAKDDLWKALMSFKSDRFQLEEERRKADFVRVMEICSKATKRDLAAVRVNQRAVRAANDNAASCYIYFVTDGEAIKIGKATNPKARLSGLQTSHHRPLYFLGILPGDGAGERYLHGMFSRHRLRGEWFRDHPEIRDFLAQATSIGMTYPDLAAKAA